MTLSIDLVEVSNDEGLFVCSGNAFFFIIPLYFVPSLRFRAEFGKMRTGFHRTKGLFDE